MSCLNNKDLDEPAHPWDTVWSKVYCLPLHFMLAYMVKGPQNSSFVQTDLLGLYWSQTQKMPFHMMLLNILFLTGK